MTITKRVGVYDYDLISQITGKSSAAVYQDVTRGNLDMDDLRTVIVYLARHADPELKAQILASMTERDLDLSVYTKKRKAAMRRRSEANAKKATGQSRQARKKPARKKAASR